jgi:hypothetical protein
VFLTDHLDENIEPIKDFILSLGSRDLVSWLSSYEPKTARGGWWWSVCLRTVTSDRDICHGPVLSPAHLSNPSALLV